MRLRAQSASAGESTAAGRWVNWLRLGCVSACLVAGGCETATVLDPHVQVVYPDALAFEVPPDFTGSWLGRLNRTRGELEIGSLKTGEYFGNFTASDGSLDVALLMEQSWAVTENGAQVPSNRLLFTWQDGAGERGHGWFHIDQRSEKLGGSSGFGEAIEGFDWEFSR